jgi:hypothetical protein
MITYKAKYVEVEDTESKIIEFFSKNPKPKDSDVHSFAEKEGIDVHKFEEIIYSLLGAFFGSGLSKNFKGKYNSKQLEMGIKVEMEHTTHKEIAKRIAMDHLAEIPDYYTRLAQMEQEAEY